MTSFFIRSRVSHAIAVPLLSALIMLGAAAAAPMTPAEAADHYTAVLSQMVAATEAVHDPASARAAMRTFVEGTRERLAAENAVDAMSPAAQTAYARLIARRRGEINAKLARFDAALARMMANPLYVQVLADTGRAAAM